MIKKTLFHKILFCEASTMNTSVTKRELRILGEISLGRDPGFLYVVASIKKLLNGRHYVQKPCIAVATALNNGEATSLSTSNSEISGTILFSITLGFPTTISFSDSTFEHFFP